MRDTLKDLIGPCLVALVFIALACGLIVGAVNDHKRNANDRRECMTSGGRIVEVHHSGGWFCEVKP